MKKRDIGMALLACAVLAGAGACKSSGSTASASPNAAPVAAQATPSKTPTPTPTPTRPAGPPMLLNTIYPESGMTVGVAMPISVVFSDPVATSARAGIEEHLKITSSAPVTGAWHWFTSTRVDWRPESYWTPGTKVTLDAELTGVGDGYGRYGTHSYVHTFSIGPDIAASVSVPGHSMTVTNDGKVVRTMPIDAGSPSFPSWDGTMAVMDKQPEVRMTSCSVGITCDKSNPNFYDITLPWDVQLTGSGTYVHYSTGDQYPGHSYGSHGCVHLSLANAKWFYNYVQVGDPITISGSPRGKDAPDNGYAAFDDTWAQWLAGSATGAHATTVD
jgi:lipoprotein-anchoring transpeptidase ErfK/SrfK